MKSINFVVLTSIFLIFTGCQLHNNKEEIKESKVDFKKLEIAGCWVNEKYYKQLASSKSPKKAQYGAKMIILPENINTTTMMIENFHEGGENLKIVSKDNYYELWEYENNKFTKKYATIKVISPGKIKVGSVPYVLINPAIVSNSPLILEEILFRGWYTNEKNDLIEFKNNGELRGMGKNKYYEPIIDYFDTGLDVDQVGIGTSKKDMKWYGFKFSGDTLLLYNLRCINFDAAYNTCAEVAFGDLAYKMWKKN